MHWFIVASQKEARVFTRTSDRRQIKLLKTLINPLGLEKRRSLVKKEAGRGIKSIGRIGYVNYSVPKPRDPHDEAVNQFAKEVSQFLEQERLKKHFSSITVVAEPRLLGKIKSRMSTRLKNFVSEWIKRDLQKTPKKDLVRFLIPSTETISQSPKGGLNV